MEKLKSINELIALRKKLQEEFFSSKKTTIRICCGTGCRSNNSLKVYEALRNTIKE